MVRKFGEDHAPPHAKREKSKQTVWKIHLESVGVFSKEGLGRKLLHRNITVCVHVLRDLVAGSLDHNQSPSSASRALWAGAYSASAARR